MTSRGLAFLLLLLGASPAAAQTAPVLAQNGGTGVANNAANTLTFSGAFPLTLTLGGSTSVTLPASGTLATTDANLSAQHVVAYIHTANMNVTTDQAMTVNGSYPARWKLVGIDVQNCSGNPNVAAGGFYTAASKGGTTLVAATQTYSGANTAIVQVTLAAGIATTPFTSATTPIFSLTSGQGSAMTCDIDLIGIGYP